MVSLNSYGLDILNIPSVFSPELLYRCNSHMGPATRTVSLEINAFHHNILVSECSDPVLIFLEAQETGDTREASLG